MLPVAIALACQNQPLESPAQCSVTRCCGTDTFDMAARAPAGGYFDPVSADNTPYRDNYEAWISAYINTLLGLLQACKSILMGE